MSFFKKKEFESEITRKIESLKLEDVLLHKEFFSTIRNESEVLYDRILNTNLKYQDRWLGEILEYALLNKEAPEEYKELNNINQINHNAANFLENCGKRFAKLINEGQKIYDFKGEIMHKINNFINLNEEKSVNLNPMYAGHFQRFIGNFLRLEILDVAQTIDQLAPFLVQHCNILAYQQLLSRFLSDFSVGNEKTIYSLLSKMLYRAHKATEYVFSNNSEDNSVDNMTSTVKINQINNKRENITEDSQPLSLNKKPIPLINDILGQGNFSHDIEPFADEPVIPFKNVDQIEAKFKSIEDAEFEAYLLLMSIRIALYDQTELVDQFRNDSENDYALINALFYCGTRCSATSLVSLEAFRLLGVIFNGSRNLQVEPWVNSEAEKQTLSFYSRYADEMVFYPKTLSYKMIHAFPIFWEHRYNCNAEDESSLYKPNELETTEIDVSNYYNDKKKHFYKREPGESALEILQPCLFCDPLISSQLTYSYIDIFIQLAKKRKEINGDPEKVDQMVKLDGTVLDFYQHHFEFGEIKNTTFPDLFNVIIPLVPNDPIYQKELNEKKRASLSGFLVDFLLRMSSMKTNTFFDIGGKQLASKMAKTPQFEKINSLTYLIFQYKEITNFEFLSSNVLYNIPCDNDFNFGGNYDDDDEEDEADENSKFTLKVPLKKRRKKKVKVDELDGNNDDRKTKSQPVKKKKKLPLKKPQ